MIKQKGIKHWIICCDRCDKIFEENGYIPHYETKKKAIEFIRSLNVNKILCGLCFYKIYER